MNPYDERRLRDEVIYLHYLWDQGPPHHQQTNPNHLPILSLHSTIHSSSSQPHLHLHHPSQLRHHHREHPFAPSLTRSLPPVTSTAFKKINNKKKRENKSTKPDPPQNQGLPWPCPGSPDSPPQTGWPVPKPSSIRPPSSQEKERFAALRAQNKAIKTFREFLIGSDEDNDGFDEEDDDIDEDGGDRLEEFEEFFIGVFMKDNELRGYYQRCFENGEFLCLVCGAFEKKKSGKKYKDCIGLVQHSTLILRTANKKAHRAFGQAVCKVLGWDIHRLPTIVMNGEPLGKINPAQPPGESTKKVDEDGIHISGYEAVALGHDDETVEEQA